MSKVLPIAIVTFKGFLRSKVSYGIAGILLLYILSLSLMMVQMSSTEGSSNLETHFVSFSCAFFQFFAFFVAVICSAFLIVKEVKERTILFVLTRALGSFDFIVGKWLGAVIFLSFTVFSFAVPFYIVGLIFFKKFYFYQAIFFLSSIIGLSMLSAFVLTLSLKASALLAIVFPLILNTSWIGGLIAVLKETAPAGLVTIAAKEAGLAALYAAYYILPSFDKVILEPADIIWGKKFLFDYLFTLAYTADITVIYLLIGVLFFNRKRKQLVGSVT